MSKPWPEAYLDLKPRIRRIINNFMGSRPVHLSQLDHAMNWRSDCISYSCPAFMHDYFKVAELYAERGPISEV